MKRIPLLTVAAVLLASNAFATYIVVMKDGTRYRAKEKWTVRDGRALVTLETGATIQFDPKMIDEKATDEANKLGLGDARLIAVETKEPTVAAPANPAPLGSVTTLRKVPSPPPSPTRKVAEPMPPTEASGPPLLGSDVSRMFSKAYDNVGLFDARIEQRPGYSLRVQLTADNEDEVFKALSATSYVMTHIPDTRVDLVELFMATLNGGSAGRFQITRDDAVRLNEKKITWQDYYLAKVIF